MVTREGCWPRMPPRFPLHTDPTLTPPTRGTIWACAPKQANRSSEPTARICLLPNNVADHGSRATRRGECSSGDTIANVGNGKRADRGGLHVQDLARLGIF